MEQPIGLKQSRHGIRGAFLDCVADPFFNLEADAVRYISDGLLVIEQGQIIAFDHYETLQEKHPDLSIQYFPKRLIVPGFIDTHVHYPQTEMIGAYGEQLLEWLNRYTFPTEQKFKDKAYARKIADRFLDELLRNGTTTALVFAAVYPESVDAFFEAAEARNLCMITGKVMMNRNAPEALCDSVESSYEDSKALIQKWHGRGRLKYAVTPRFAPTSTPQQLEAAGRLLKEFPDVYLHTHLSENLDEVEWVKSLFTNADNYLDTYDQAGLVTNRSIFAHCIHLEDEEWQRLSEAESAIAFCPTSNLFLGSGLFAIEKAKSKEHPVKLGFGSDVGAGTSFSMLKTANEAYKVAQLRRQKLSPFQSLYLMTLGGAIALNLDSKLGNFDVGKEADFNIINPYATEVMKQRMPQVMPQTLTEISDMLFATLILGDDRAIEQTFILGEQ